MRGHEEETGYEDVATVAYALQATLQLARLGRGADAHPLQSPGRRRPDAGRFLLQVLRNLVRHGILQSTRGVDGGYSLERSPADISLLDVIEAVDGPMASLLPVHEGLPDGSRRSWNRPCGTSRT